MGTIFEFNIFVNTIMIIYIIHIGTTISKLIKTKEKDTIKAKKSKNN